MRWKTVCRQAMGAQLRKRRSMLWAVASVIVLALMATGGIHIYQLNVTYPSPTLVEHQQGEMVSGQSLRMTVTKARLLGNDQLAELLPDYKVDSFDEHGQELDKSRLRMLIVDVDVANSGSDEQALSLNQFAAQSKAWHNGLDTPAFLDLNNGSSMTLTLAGGESAHVVLPYLMSESQFGEGDWAQAEERPYELVLAVYPILDVVQLQLSK